MSKQTLFLAPRRKELLDSAFRAAFGAEPKRYFSAPGRTEIGGNHTDHQHGRVLAAAVDLDTVAAVALNGTNLIRVQSEGYPLCTVSLDCLTPVAEEVNTTASLIRGVAARFSQLGCPVQGFDAYVSSTVLPGSGLSSSAAFEVLMGTVINGLFDGGMDAPAIAIIGQYAENVFFGKPCGLMDQMASSVGSMVAIDFADPAAPIIEPIAFDFAACGHALCIIDTRASHADLTDEYAAVPREMKSIAAHFGKEVLRDVAQEDFYTALPQLRKAYGDRAVLRAIHFFGDNDRVPEQVAALRANDFDTFLKLVTESGQSSFMYLQNVTPAGYVANQDVAVALSLCRHYLQGRGAYRVHGGGFAGTVQAFVPMDLLDSFRSGMDAALGEGACHVLSIRPQGGTEMAAE